MPRGVQGGVHVGSRGEWDVPLRGMPARRILDQGEFQSVHALPPRKVWKFQSGQDGNGGVSSVSQGRVRKRQRGQCMSEVYPRDFQRQAGDY